MTSGCQAWPPAERGSAVVEQMEFVGCGGLAVVASTADCVATKNQDGTVCTPTQEVEDWGQRSLACCKGKLPDKCNRWVRPPPVMPLTHCISEEPGVRSCRDCSTAPFHVRQLEDSLLPDVAGPAEPRVNDIGRGLFGGGGLVVDLVAFDTKKPPCFTSSEKFFLGGRCIDSSSN
jgi:hypothetical protein